MRNFKNKFTELVKKKADIDLMSWNIGNKYQIIFKKYFYISNDYIKEFSKNKLLQNNLDYDCL